MTRLESKGQWWLDPVAAPDQLAREQALDRQRQLLKPPGSLGRLEQVAVDLAAMQGRSDPQLERVWITIFAADHAVTGEGVSAYPQSVTGQMVHAFSRGHAAISILAREHAAALEVVDVGLVNDPGPLPGVVSARIAAGSRNPLHGPALDQSTVEQALNAGRDALERAGHCDLWIGGEMGIGNTTAATAIAALLLNLPPIELVGPGTGLDAAGVARKVAVVARSVARHREAAGDPFATLSAVGGLEIAALCGAILAAASKRIPILVDGFIVSVAALLAVRLNPSVAQWLIHSHRSAEPGHRRVLAALGADPLLDLGMRLGEGSGAAVALATIKLAATLHNGMATFTEAGVADGSSRGSGVDG